MDRYVPIWDSPRPWVTFCYKSSNISNKTGRRDNILVCGIHSYNESNIWVEHERMLEIPLQRAISWSLHRLKFNIDVDYETHFSAAHIFDCIRETEKLRRLALMLWFLRSHRFSLSAMKNPFCHAKASFVHLNEKLGEVINVQFSAKLRVVRTLRLSG